MGGADGPTTDGLVAERPPLPYRTAAAGVGRCIAVTLRLLATHRIHRQRHFVGRRLHFADGSVGRVYRDTVADVAAVDDPCVLVVTFRLRAVRGAAHAVFRWESLLNTPLFVGFPGFVSKLWLAHDEHGRYRGVYEWDGPARAESYARCLWRVLALVSDPDSIHYVVVPGLRRDDVLAAPHRLDAVAPADARAWWRIVDVS